MVVQLTPRYIIFTLFKRWKEFSAFVIVAIALTVLAILFPFWKYESTAIIVPTFNVQDLADPQLQQANGGTGPTASTTGDLAKLLVESMANTGSSYDIERKTVEAMGIKTLYPTIGKYLPILFGTELDAAVDKLDSDLDVSVGKDSTTLDFKLKNGDPEVAQKALRTLIDFFIQIQAKVEHNPRLDILQQQLADGRLKVDSAEKQLLDFKRKEGVSDLATEQKLLLSQRDDYQENLSNALAALAGAKNMRDDLARLLAATPAQIAVSDENDETKMRLDDAKDKVLVAEQTYLTAKQTFGTKNGLLEDKAQALQLARQEYDELAKSPGQRVRTGPNPVRQALETEFQQSDAQVAADQATADVWQERLADVNGRNDHLNAVEADVNDLQRELDLATTDYTSFMQRSQEARIKEALNSGSVTSLTVVQTPDLPYIPKRFYLVLVLGVVGGVLGGVGLCMALEGNDETLGLPQQVEPAVKLPVLVTLSYQPNGAVKAPRKPGRAA